MRVVLTVMLATMMGLSGFALAATHAYSRADRYEGCLFGEVIPLMRRGAGRERALSIASDRCIAWSQGLSAGDIRSVDAALHIAIDRLERSGL